MKAAVILGIDVETDIGSWTPFYEGLQHGTPRLLDCMAKRAVVGTFFFTGDAARTHPRMVRLVAEAAERALDTWLAAAGARSEGGE